jgi:hypothetical protein
MNTVENHQWEKDSEDYSNTEIFVISRGNETPRTMSREFENFF